MPSEGIESATLNIDGQTLTYSGGATAAKQFTWPGAQPGVKATAKFGDITTSPGPPHSGLWSVFRFFGRADKPVGFGPSSSLEWVIRIGDQPAQLPNQNRLPCGSIWTWGITARVSKRLFLESDLRGRCRKVKGPKIGLVGRRPPLAVRSSK